MHSAVLSVLLVERGLGPGREKHAVTKVSEEGKGEAHQSRCSCLAHGEMVG